MFRVVSPAKALPLSKTHYPPSDHRDAQDMLTNDPTSNFSAYLRVHMDFIPLKIVELLFPRYQTAASEGQRRMTQFFNSVDAFFQDLGVTLGNTERQVSDSNRIFIILPFCRLFIIVFVIGALILVDTHSFHLPITFLVFPATTIRLTHARMTAFGKFMRDATPSLSMKNLSNRTLWHWRKTLIPPRE